MPISWTAAQKYPAVPLGEYIEQCDERAGDNFTVDDVIGISTDKNPS